MLEEYRWVTNYRKDLNKSGETQIHKMLMSPHRAHRFTQSFDKYENDKSCTILLQHQVSTQRHTCGRPMSYTWIFLQFVTHLYSRASIEVWQHRSMEKQLFLSPYSFFCLAVVHPVTGPFHFWETHNKKHRMSLVKQQTQWWETSNGETEWKRLVTDQSQTGAVSTSGPGVQLCVQNLQRMHRVPLWAGCALCWINWTRHFLFFFVLHLRIDVETWDLPWGKIYSEATA